MSRVYKEGQGKWSRGLLAMIIVLGAVFALSQLHEHLPRWDKWTIPGLGFDIDPRFLLYAPILIASAYLAFRLFNRPQTADFLIETESELKNKVTWPSQREEVNATIVVVATTFLIGVFIFLLDFLFSKLLTQFWYGA